MFTFYIAKLKHKQNGLNSGSGYSFYFFEQYILFVFIFGLFKVKCITHFVQMIKNPNYVYRDFYQVLTMAVAKYLLNLWAKSLLPSSSLLAFAGILGALSLQSLPCCHMPSSLCVFFICSGHTFIRYFLLFSGLSLPFLYSVCSFSSYYGSDSLLGFYVWCDPRVLCVFKKIVFI